MVDCFFLLVLHQMCTNLTLGKRVTNSRLTQNGQSKSPWILWSTRRETLPDTTHTQTDRQTDFFRNTPIMQIIHSAHDRKLISEHDALAIRSMAPTNASPSFSGCAILAAVLLAGFYAESRLCCCPSPKGLFFHVSGLSNRQCRPAQTSAATLPVLQRARMWGRQLL